MKESPMNYLGIIDIITEGINKHDPLVKDYFEKEHDKICCVCLDGVADRQLNCVHKLCELCYNRLNKCPLCRTMFKSKQIHYHIMNSVRIDIHDRPYHEAVMQTSHNFDYFWERLNHIIKQYPTGIPKTTPRRNVLKICHTMNFCLDRYVFYRKLNKLDEEDSLLQFTWNNEAGTRDNDYFHITRDPKLVSVLRNQFTRIKAMILDYFRSREFAQYFYII